MIGVAQDAQGEARVQPVVDLAGTTFPILVDRRSELAACFGFQITPSGVFLDRDATVRYVHGSVEDQFDVADPRVRLNLDLHLAGRQPIVVGAQKPGSSEALEIFAQGSALFDAGDSAGALDVWRKALARDPDNFLVRSQIWAVEHPERFWPAVDREWQSAQLLREGYEKPLP